MRLLGVLVVAIVMYVAVPLLWQRAMVDEVNAVSANAAGIPVGNAVEINYAASENLVNAMKAPEINQEEINKSEQLGAQSAADDALRHMQAAQDQAWQASH